MFHNKSKVLPRLAVLIALLAGLVLGVSSLLTTQTDQKGSNGEFAVSVLHDGIWQTIGTLPYGKQLDAKELDLSDFRPSGEVKVRIGYSGHTAAHIDSLLLGGRAPRTVLGASEDTSLALKKLASSDCDVIDARDKTLTFIFDVEDQAPTLSLTARIEPERLSGSPFQFPLENLFKKLDGSSSFYRYALNSQPGKLDIDGALEAENLEAPLFEVFAKPGSGHPSDSVYGWVRNDDQNLYVALDFVPDNTMDGDKDYAKVYVNTQAGLKEFQVSVPEQKWGVPGFVYTSRAVYQHKVYEFAIPFAEIGMAQPKTGEPIELALAAYGTATAPGGRITIIEDAIPNSPQDFLFAMDGQLGFYLDDDDDPTLPNSKEFIVPFQPASVTINVGEIVPGGWVLSGILCDDPDGGTIIDLGGATASIDLDQGETVTCTFTNGQQDIIPVGGYVAPVDKLNLLSPWMMLAGLTSLTALTAVLVRRRRG